MSTTIKQAIEALKTHIAGAYAAVFAKGGTLPATQDSANLPAAIASIPTCGGTKVKMSGGTFKYLPYEDFGVTNIEYWHNFSFDSLFFGCPNVKVIDFTQTNVVNVFSWWTRFCFYNSQNLEILDLRFASIPTPTSAYNQFWFYDNRNLRVIRAGSWMIYSVEITPAGAMTRETIVQFLQDLPLPANNSQTIIMGAAKLALLTAEDRAIAIDKGWQLA